MTLSEWLQLFKKRWIEKDVPGVLELFTDDVEYWENSFRELLGKTAISEEWQVVKSQKNIELDTEIFSENKGSASIVWTLRYEDSDSNVYVWSGVYLMKLNDSGLCYYFRQVGEKNNGN